MSATEEIKSRLDIVDIVGEHVQLRKSGRSYSGFCPFHSNSRTPAFVVFPESQSWRCFGACADGGDIFGFMMKKHGWDFKETLQNLADRAGVKLEDYRQKGKGKTAVSESVNTLLADAASYWHQLLMYAPEAEPVRKYVATRGISDETLEHFQIGFSLNSWDAARNHFSAQGYSTEDMLAAGLLTLNEEKQTTYDRFRQRLMIPIKDAGGEIVGFGARALAKDAIPKYLNSPQTQAFDKSRILFGLNDAKKQIRDERQAVIVEGYMDVIAAWQAGFTNVVAQMGTALTEQQLRLLKRYTKRFVLALDADAAGAQATLRGLQVARETLDHEAEIMFDSRGLVQHEGRLKADIRVMTLPDGKDPDDIMKKEPQLWPLLVQDAKPIVDYVIDVLTEELDPSDAKRKTDISQQVLPLIADVGDSVERDHYRQRLARILGVNERSLRIARSEQRKTQQRKAERKVKHNPRPVTKANKTADARQFNYLSQCLQIPELLRQVDVLLIREGQEPVSEIDFKSAVDQALHQMMKQGGATETADDALQTRIAELTKRESTNLLSVEQAANKLVLSVLGWRLDDTKQLLQAVEQLLQDAQRNGDDEMLSLYSQQKLELPRTILRINKAKQAMSSASRRQAEG